MSNPSINQDSNLGLGITAKELEDIIHFKLLATSLPQWDKNEFIL